jgi:hypothetical protein
VRRLADHLITIRTASAAASLHWVVLAATSIPACMSEARPRTRSQAREAAQQQGLDPHRQQIQPTDSSNPSHVVTSRAAAQTAADHAELPTDGTRSQQQDAHLQQQQQGLQEQSTAPLQWQKVLWKRQPFADNYTDAKFLQHMVRVSTRPFVQLGQCAAPTGALTARFVASVYICRT